MANITPRRRGVGNSITAITVQLSQRARQLYHTCQTTISQTTIRCQASIAGLQFNILGLLCYVLGWISGIVLLLTKKEASFVRFHAWQSIVTFGILTVPILVLNLLPSTKDILYLILTIVYWIVIAFTVSLWVLLMVKAYQGHTYSLPAVSGIVSRLSHVEGRKFLPEKPVLKVVAIGDIPVVVTAPEVAQETQQVLEKLRGVLTDAVASIVTLCESRDPYTAYHQYRVSKLACAIATELGFSPDHIEGIRIMGILHDIGKVAVPTEILSKPGKISDFEFGIIKTHPKVAYDILKSLNFPWPVAQAIFQHHERLDGSGYPNELSGESIILEARILAVSDVVEAMASHRPYRPALGIDAALKEITQNKGTLFDASVVEACLTLFNQKHFKLG